MLVLSRPPFLFASHSAEAQALSRCTFLSHSPTVGTICRRFTLAASHAARAFYDHRRAADAADGRSADLSSAGGPPNAQHAP